MNNSYKAVAKLIAVILGNIGAIGFGLALFEGKSSCGILAMVAVIMACCTEWRANQ